MNSSSSVCKDQAILPNAVYLNPSLSEKVVYGCEAAHRFALTVWSASRNWAIFLSAVGCSLPTALPARSCRAEKHFTNSYPNSPAERSRGHCRLAKGYICSFLHKTQKLHSQLPAYSLSFTSDCVEENRVGVILRSILSAADR